MPGLRESATKLFANAPARSARLRLDQAETAGGRTIPTGLRARRSSTRWIPILVRRYQRARAFAEDLDRWRSNRPLAFAVEPFWRSRIPNWVRRRKRFLFVAGAALSIVLGLPTTMLMILSGRRLQEDFARHNLNRHWNGTEAYRFRPLTSEWLEDPVRGAADFRLTDPGDPRALESARGALEDFGVFGPGDWRRNESFSYLHGAEREDLELWLMEQAYRYSVALSERPESRHDWERARNLLDRLEKTNRLPVFANLAASLNAKLDQAGSNASRAERSVIDPGQNFSPNSQSAPVWMNEYLLGVADECEIEVPEKRPIPLPGDLANLDSRAIRPASPGRASSARALEHYRKLLAIRPESYWGNYRAAGVCYVLGAFAESAQHLARCLAIRPDNAVIRGQRAACLVWLGRYSEAREECDRALEEAPDLATLYRIRAFIRAGSGQTHGLAADIEHFELLRRILPADYPNNTLKTEQSEPELLSDRTVHGLGEFSGGFGLRATLEGLPYLASQVSQVSAVDRGELSMRLELASKIRDVGDRELASNEYAKILLLDPDHIPARTFRALSAIDHESFDQAEYDLKLVLNHPQLIEYLRRNPTLLHSLLQASRRFSLSGRVEEGQALARKVADCANALHQLRSEAHYNLARAYAMSAREDPEYVSRSATELWWALVAHPDYQHYYIQDSTFDSVRDQIDRELRDKPDPVDEYRRAVADRLVQPH